MLSDGTLRPELGDRMTSDPSAQSKRSEMLVTCKSEWKWKAGLTGDNSVNAQTEPPVNMLLRWSLGSDLATDRFEQYYIPRSLGLHKGLKGKTAETLGISRKTLCRKLRKFGMD